jgi:hypothetical protein
MATSLAVVTKMPPPLLLFHRLLTSIGYQRRLESIMRLDFVGRLSGSVQSARSMSGEY